MRVLSFPGLGLEFELNRVAFSVLGRPIYWYGIIIAFGFFLAYLYCTRQSKKFGIRSEDVVDLLLFAVPLCILGARAYYVIFYLDLYRREDGSLDFMEMLRIWDGGLAIYGGIIVAVLVLAVFCKVRKINFLAFADLGVFGLLIGQSVGRWGNFMNIEAYGGVTDLPWRMCSTSIAQELFLQKGLIDQATYDAILEGTLGVHPTFFYESLWNLIGLGILILLLHKGRKFDGQTFYTYLIWYGLGRFWIEGLRTDSLYLFQTGLRVSQGVALLSCCAGILLYLWTRGRKKGVPLYVDRIAKGGEDHGDQT